jgi:hypothetical protein
VAVLGCPRPDPDPAGLPAILWTAAIPVVAAAVLALALVVGGNVLGW